jgi:cleavage stimulation factor subunit 3
LKEFEDKETAQLVDRYRFLDLYPCSVAELRAIGYSQSLQGSHKGLSAIGNMILDEEPSLVLPRPDFGQMIPYKPKANAHPGEHIVPGGVFPLPPSASHLCTILPPPSSFRGPFVSIDAMIEIFGKIQLPDNGELN